MPYRNPTAIPSIAVLLAVEILSLSFFIDTALLTGRGGFTEGVGEYGRSALSALITFMLLCLAASATATRCGISCFTASIRPYVPATLARPLLAALVSVPALVYLSNTHTSGIVADVTMALWIIGVGVAAYFAVLAANSGCQCRGDPRRDRLVGFDCIADGVYCGAVTGSSYGHLFGPSSSRQRSISLKLTSSRSWQ